MGYTVTLTNEDEEPVTVDRFATGGDVLYDGSTEAEVVVPFKYRDHFPFRPLYGKVARDTILTLQDAVERLGVEKDPDYWNPTPGNVGFTCQLLLLWAQQHPDAVWKTY